MGIEFVDQSEAARQMGRKDHAAGKPYTYGCEVFLHGSPAYANWCQGWLGAENEARRLTARLAELEGAEDYMAGVKE